MGKWWKKAFGYQIYIRSFKDSNHDGIGDIRGIIEKLDYLSYLGINLIWICPFFESPMDDNGYDVSDFYNVSGDYGDMSDIKELIAKAHQKKIKIIIDLILNQTSDEHHWFQESRKSKDNPYRDYYIWAPPRIIDGKQTEPTNWASFFGGSCWEYDQQTNEYYMKIFSRKMPDLNWKNPKVREEIINIAKYWLDLGIDGFRLDAVAHLGKSELIDSTYQTSEKYKPEWEKYSNLPIVHDYLRELNQKVFSKYDIVTVGEVGGRALVEDALLYVSPKRKELDMVFNFDHNWCNNGWNRKKGEKLKINVPLMKEIFNKWQSGLQGKGWNAIYWLNHDQPRVASHYGDSDYFQESVKMLAVCMYFMWGTPFIYNGEEIGMTNPKFKSIDDFKDVSIHNQYRINVLENKQDPDDFINQVSYSTRDNARTIMQWSNEEYAGFGKAKPWNMINDNYPIINVKDEIEDENSILHFYRKIIDIRLNSEYNNVITFGKYQQLAKEHSQMYLYLRQYRGKKILVICNLTCEKVKMDELGYKIKKIILSNYERKEVPFEFASYEAIVLEVE
ncbi:MAG TPA: alpha-glucosidase [Bacilli bacterium]|jgi:glycosidase|nr:alpha-glucosidase [Acholeplasmataceae bacterium]HNZ77601.1 alpha-glucosidase [Bacilli bacterium]HOD60512.1 alpha-glucosidase [Bacilli bacterium]HOH61742.1 alpha-glucosidase [Bacilli bacterium]HPB49102.1 alpha-glucosidase [Bacilli bacterium]